MPYPTVKQWVISQSPLQTNAQSYVLIKTGIGYSNVDQRVWLTFNGEFLNPPPIDEV